jgi:hypothetical protein
MKMLKHQQSPKNVQPCLAELNFGISLDGSFDSSKQLSFDVSMLAKYERWNILFMLLSLNRNCK